ncbi:MAG: phosphatase PAP2 family protein [Polyangiaceae bacterium]|jgi:inositol phosphorylceramide synthase catalytic subunit
MGTPPWAILALAPFAADAAWAEARGELRWEHLAALGLAATLLAAGACTRRFLAGAYPFTLVAVLYDATSPFASVGVTPDRVHLCDLRARELALFGTTMNGERVTWHDWWQAHPSHVLDVICAVPYATFIIACCACAAWLFVRDHARFVRFCWSFFALNVTGFATYQLYPAAPPWYFHSHGCTVDTATRASAGPALTRVDDWLGVGYFAGMYGRASHVFGAMPSLHVGYAFIIVLVGWASFSLAWRAASIAFYALMAFSAVYLDHHWILDTIAGSAFSVAAVVIVGGVARARRVATP